MSLINQIINNKKTSSNLLEVIKKLIIGYSFFMKFTVTVV
jgi:hypothetical protein